MKTRLFFAVSIFAFLFWGCSSKSGVTPLSNSGSSVSIQNYAFVPDTLTISKGSTVTWTNADNVTHTVYEQNTVFSSGNLTPGNTYSFTFPNVGNYIYYCQIHSMMKKAIVIVK